MKDQCHADVLDSKDYVHNSKSRQSSFGKVSLLVEHRLPFRRGNLQFDSLLVAAVLAWPIWLPCTTNLTHDSQ